LVYIETAASEFSFQAFFVNAQLTFILPAMKKIKQTNKNKKCNAATMSAKSGT
jgi:hypothetical protein